MRPCQVFPLCFISWSCGFVARVGVGFQLETKLCPQGPGRICDYTRFSIYILQSGEEGNRPLVSGQTTATGRPPSGTELWCDHRQVAAWHYPDQQQKCGWLPLSCPSSLEQPEGSMQMGNTGHTDNVLLKTTGAGRGRRLLPSLVQLHALFNAVGQMHRKQFCSGQNCQTVRQQDISGTRTRLLVSRFSITPRP